jgi:thiol-disulfide isomerase/thioredoxin
MSARLPILRLLCCILWGATAIAAQEPAEWATSIDQARSRASSTNRLILVDLYADWCHWCKRLDADVFSTPEFQSYAQKYVLLRVDTEDGAEGTRLQERFSAYSLPTTLILDHRMVKYGEVRGYAPTGHYIREIEQEIAQFRALEAGYDRFGSTDDPEAMAVLAEEFHQRGDGDRASHLYRRLLQTESLPVDEANWTRLSLADALRLDERYEMALEVASDARERANRTGDLELVERLDLIQAQVSLDRGDCPAAKGELRRFIVTHPNSQLRSWAQRALSDLESDPSTCA